MEEKLLLTYSLLGYLKETSINPTSSLTEIFIPIVKKTLSDYSKENGLIEIKGKSLVEIQAKIFRIFEIEIPIPILLVILKSIERDVDDKQIFAIFKDNSFILKSYVFDDIEEQIIKEKNNIRILQNDYMSFCRTNNYKYNFSDLKEFILAQKIDLFSDKNSSYLNLEYFIPKYIKQSFDNEEVFNTITNIYLGGIISSYLTLKITKKITDVELLIDTNFFISLIDLNTEDSYHTCNQLFELCTRMGFRFTMLNTTVEQIKSLLSNRIYDFANRDFIGSIKSADVFNACIRNNIDKTQLERIKDNIPFKLNELGIVIIQEAQIQSIVQEAKKSKMYKDLVQIRGFEHSALNDAIAELYVKSKRGINIQEFSDVKCWFLHNSFHSYYYDQNQKIFDRYSISANELLVLLWLTNPSQAATVQDKVIAQGTISSYITRYRRHRAPTKEILRVLKNRADKALEHGQILEKDVFNICLRMAEGDLSKDDVSDIEEISDIDFANRLKEYSSEAEMKNNMLSKQNKEKTINLENQQITIETQELKIDKMSARIQELENREYEREKEKKDEIKRRNQINWIFISIIVVLIGLIIILVVPNIVNWLKKVIYFITSLGGLWGLINLILNIWSKKNKT